MSGVIIRICETLHPNLTVRCHGCSYKLDQAGTPVTAGVPISRPFDPVFTPSLELDDAVIPQDLQLLADLVGDVFVFRMSLR